MTTDGRLSPYPAAGPVVRPGLRPVLTSLGLAAATFSLLPLFGLLSARQHERIPLSPAPDVVPAPTRVPPLDRTPPAREPLRRPKLRQKPEPRRPRQRIEAMETRLSLAMTSLMEGMGDFSLDFEIAPGEGPRVTDGGPTVFELAELDSLPRPLVRLRPIYPSRARQQGIEGFVELVFVVTSGGKVEDVRVVRSDPGDVFVDAAVAAVRRWRFAPGQKEGAPVTARVRQVIRFRLEDR